MNNLYKDMTALLHPEETANFKLDTFSIDSSNFRAMISGIPTGNYVRLIDKREGVWNEVIMSDTPMEKNTNSEFVSVAHGDILIAGLGIGLIPMAIQDKDNVTSITIVEKENEIIDLITSQLPFNSKVRVVEEDIYRYRPDHQFDCIYIDIWPYVNSDIYKDMLFLKDGFRRYLKPTSQSPNRYIKCWAETQARYNLNLH